jgi:hypothetical protein
MRAAACGAFAVAEPITASLAGAVGRLLRPVTIA